MCVISLSEAALWRRSVGAALAKTGSLAVWVGRVIKPVQMGSVYIWVWPVQMWSTPDSDPYCRLVRKFSPDGGLPTLHSADEYASTWLISVAKEAEMKNCSTNTKTSTDIYNDIYIMFTWLKTNKY